MRKKKKRREAENDGTRREQIQTLPSIIKRTLCCPIHTHTLSLSSSLLDFLDTHRETLQELRGERARCNGGTTAERLELDVNDLSSRLIDLDLWWVELGGWVH